MKKRLLFSCLALTAIAAAGALYRQAPAFLPKNAHLLRSRFLRGDLGSCTPLVLTVAKEDCLEEVYWTTLEYPALQRHFKKAGIPADEMGGWQVSLTEWGGFAGRRFSSIGRVQLPREAKSYIVFHRPTNPLPISLRWWLLVTG